MEKIVDSMLDYLKGKEERQKKYDDDDLLGTVSLDAPASGADEIKSIDAILRSDSHFPSHNSEAFLKRKAEILLSRKEARAAGLALLNSQYLSFRHKALIRHSQLLARRAEEEERKRKAAAANRVAIH